MGLPPCGFEQSLVRAEHLQHVLLVERDEDAATLLLRHQVVPPLPPVRQPHRPLEQRHVLGTHLLLERRGHVVEVKEHLPIDLPQLFGAERSQRGQLVAWADEGHLVVGDPPKTREQFVKQQRVIDGHAA